jgi:hypothetical protein
MAKDNKQSVGRPKKEDTENYQRATFIVSKENLYKLKAIAYFERLSEKDTINTAIESYINSLSESKLKEALDTYAKKK